MLYAHIGVYHYSTGKIDVKDEKALFSEQINNLLRSYKDGYYLERSNGFIMEMPNKALQEQLSYDGAELSEDVLESFNRFLIISLDVLICRYSPLFRAFPALFISEEPHKSFYYPLCFRSQK